MKPNHKAIALLFLVFALVVALAGCRGTKGSQAVNTKDNASREKASQGSSDSPKTNQSADPEKSSGSDSPDNPIKPNANSRILVLYFSRTGEQSGVGVISKGNTAIVADMIADITGATKFEIQPVDDHYPMTYKALTDVAKREQNEKARPTYQGKSPDLSAYDTVFIGAPVWWGDWPMILYTVFEGNNFSGKTLVPFCTHEGSGLSEFDKKLASACPSAKVRDGIAVRGSHVQNKQNEVRDSLKSWIKTLGY